MLTQILWWARSALISFLLVRSLSGYFFRKYISLYFYLNYVLLQDVLRFYVYVAHPGAYQISIGGTLSLSGLPWVMASSGKSTCRRLQPIRVQPEGDMGSSSARVWSAWLSAPTSGGSSNCGGNTFNK